MATVTAQISLTSTDLLSDELSASVGGSASVLFEASDFSAPAYLYVKNTDSTATDYIFVYDGTTSGNPVILKLAGGDWAFLPLNAGISLKAYATTGGTLLEFMVIGTDA